MVRRPQRVILSLAHGSCLNMPLVISLSARKCTGGQSASHQGTEQVDQIIVHPTPTPYLPGRCAAAMQALLCLFLAADHNNRLPARSLPGSYRTVQPPTPPILPGQPDIAQQI